MGSFAERHPHIQEAVQHTADAITNPVATGMSGGTGVLVFLHAEMPFIVATLTACVLACQLCAWLYKGYKKLKTTDLYKRLTGK